MPPSSKTTQTQPDEAAADTAPVDNPTNAPAGDDFELVYVCNPKVHKDAETRPTPGRVSRLWLTMNEAKGWVECDANGKEL